MQYAQLKQRQNENLQNSIGGAVDDYTKARENKGFDLEKLSQQAVLKSEMGIEPNAEEKAAFNAYQKFESAKMGMDPYTGQVYPKYKAFGLDGPAPSGGLDFKTLAQTPGFVPSNVQTSVEAQPLPDSFIGGVNDAVGQAPAPAVPLDVSMLQPTGDPNMDAYRAKMFEQNQGMVGDALPPVAPKMSGFDTELVAPQIGLNLTPEQVATSPRKANEAAIDFASKAAEVPLEAQKAAAVESAKLQAEKTAGKPKAEAALVGAAEKSKNIDETIDRALSKINAQTAGMGSAIKDIPLVGKGSQAKDLASLLDTISADSAFSELQTMRDNSKTGGALGSITERELALLQNAAAALNQDQSPAQLRENLQKYKQIRKAALERAYTAFEKENGYRPQGQETPKSQAKSWQEYFN